MMHFEALGLCEPLLRAVAREGYHTATPIQAAAIPPLLEGCDLLGSAQTGTGKTAAFVLPMLQRISETKGSQPSGDARASGGERSRQPNDRARHPGAPRQRPRVRGLILAPTRELAAQIGSSLEVYGSYTAIRHTVIVGGVGQHGQARALQRGVDIIVATPGRLLDLMQQGLVDLRGVEMFVLDEADRMLDMGFLPDVERVVGRLPAQCQKLMFSATMPGPIERLARHLLRQPTRVQIEPVRATADLIDHSVCFVPPNQRATLLVEQLSHPTVERAIVFTRTKRHADRLVRELDRAGIRAEAMHGNKSQNARQRTLARFRSHRPPVMVATDLAARGIDVDGVSHVFNFDMPEDAETYVHRIGRTGRAGARGKAISYCERSHRGALRAIENLMRCQLRVEEGYSLLPDQDRQTPAPTARQRPGRWPTGSRRGRPRRNRPGRRLSPC